MTTEHKKKALDYWRACDSGAALPNVARDLRWDGPQPSLPARSSVELAENWLEPFRFTLPEVERQFHILMSGKSSGKIEDGRDGRPWVAATGYLEGKSQSNFMGIPRSESRLRLRWAEFLRFEEDEIVEIQMQVDLVDWLEQISRPILPKCRGLPGVWPAPTAFDGVISRDPDTGMTRATLELGRSLLFGGLNAFDTEDLSSMGMARYFHPNVKWYGPAGIGACLSLTEFEELHQRPWLKSFPDRKVQDLASLFADGRLLAASGTVAVKATHSGEPYLDSGPAKNQPIEFSGLDFWLRTGDVFTENWVFVDFVHLFNQMGIDLMDRVSQQ